MSPRERWIVYPLLFLTLGIALRDKVIPPKEVSARRIHCGELQSAKVTCGGVLIVGQDGRPAVAAGAKGGHGVIETFSPTGSPLIQLDALGSGGIVTVWGYLGRESRELLLGHVGPDFGVFASLPRLAQRLQLAAWRPWIPSVLREYGADGGDVRGKKGVAPNASAPPTVEKKTN